MVTRVGIDGLPKELREVLPDVDLDVEKHREQFYASIQASHNIQDKVHSQLDGRTLEHMYQTQTLWDEYMSESAAQYLTAFPSSTLVLIAGLGHIQGRVAIPDRIYKRTSSTPFVIVPQPVKWSKESGLPIVSEPLSRSDADWVWYTQREIVSA